jgi:hypothetical protein
VIRRSLASLALGLFLALGGVGPSIADAAVSLPPTTTIPSADSGQDIRDIHGPIAMPARRSRWWYVGGAATVAAIAGLLFYARRRKPIAPPDERALGALAEAAVMFEGDPRQFSFAVSEIVRRYVEETFRVRASQRTTEELLADLMLDRSPVAPHRTALGEFLRYCDLAKFAGWSLSPADRTAMLVSAQTFVRATATPASPEQVRRAAIRGEGIA